jgi:nucleoside-diphosphate-sugar epimerase
MRYFVTGATGFLGGYVTARLLAEGHEVVALVSDAERGRALAGYGIRPHLGSILDPESIRRGMRGADGVFHTAEWQAIGESHRKLVDRINVEGARNVLEAARSLGVPKTVYTGSLASQGDTRGRVAGPGYQGKLLTAYDRSKHRARVEVVAPLIAARMPLVVLQPGMVYGPGDPTAMGRRFTRYVLGRAPFVPTGTAFCWGHVADVADVHYLAMQKGRPGQTYVIGGPAHTLREVLVIVGRLVGKRRGPFPVPGRSLRPLAAVLAGIGAVVPSLRGAADGLRAVAGATYLGDDGPAREELGFDPRPVASGVPDAVRALLQELFEGR